MTQFDNGVSAPVILLAEDGDRIRTLPRFLLEKQGYHVLEAAHGLEALYLARRSSAKIDVVVAELDLRFMDGLELVSHLEHLNPEVRTIFITDADGPAILRPRTVSIK